MKQAEKHYIVVNGEKTEVSQQVYYAYYQEERKEKYIVEKDNAHNVVPLNISGMEELEASQVCFTPAVPSIEDQVALQEVQTCLHQCIASLPRAERELIQALYFEGMTEKACAKKVGISQPSVNYQRKKILAKLRIMLDKMGGYDEYPIFFL